MPPPRVEPAPADQTSAEIATQPECWLRAAELAPRLAGVLPEEGERVAAIGCGTSWFVAQSYARLREAAGLGETDAFAASEMLAGRRYDRYVAITRSGTTTEVLEALAAVAPLAATTALTASAGTPVVTAARDVAVIDFADETSVVQTRFATTALALLRAHLGQDLSDAVADARRALTEPLPDEAVSAEQISFLGTGWTYGLALEAALKLREAAGAWAEAYPAMEYRHGPIAVTGPGRLAWALGPVPVGLPDDVARTGGSLVVSSIDPMAELVRVQRLAVARAAAAGLDPDRPRHLSRSIILG